MDETDRIIYNCFVSKNYKQLQQGRSSILGGWESHPHRKNFIEIEKCGWEFLKLGELGIKQIFKQRVSSEEYL